MPATLVLDFVAADDVQCLCHECRAVIDARDHMTGPDNHVYCSDHYHDLFLVCERCGEIVSADDTHDVNGNVWCEHCFDSHSFTCDDCDTSYPMSHGNIAYGNGSLCDGCYSEYYFTCESCEEVCHNDDYGSDGHCQSCSESESDDDDSSILDYSTDVVSLLRPKLDSKVHYLGIELEVESTDSCTTESLVQQSIRLLGHTYCIAKHDGSLAAWKGFELVTIPSTLADHRKHWSRFFDGLPSGLRSWNTTGRCGMHVHASRAPLSPLAIGKILVFINTPENQAFVESIAGRSASTAAITPKKISDGSKYNGDRYQAVNLQNGNTIEFRIFRGTLRREAFMKNLEFVAATIAFCLQCGMQELDVSSFCKWFKNTRKDYRSLDEWLVKHNYLPARSKPRKAVRPCA